MEAGSARGRTGRLRGRWAWAAGLALGTGVVAGLADAAFTRMVRWITWLFSGRLSYAVPDGVNPHFPWLGEYFLFVAPVVGGLLYGFIAWRFGPGLRGSGVPEVMYAVARRGGEISARVAFAKPIASAICIGCGGSVGREGPIVQTGAALGSLIGRRFGVSGGRLRLLAACGAAGGISALFNTPIAGVVFALELVLRDFEAESFGAVVLSSVTAAAIGRGTIGQGSFFSFPEFRVVSPVEYLLYGLLGVLAALIAVAFIRLRFGTEELAHRLWGGPQWLLPAAGGLGLGALLFFLPEMYGSGYGVMEGAVNGRYVLGFLLMLLVGKMVATSLTLGIGGVGGVFGPLLFMGAVFGGAFGEAASGLMPSLVGTAGAYGLVGMAAMFAGAAQAPFTAAITVFELTGQYSIILPLMAAVALATGVSRALTLDTIYLLGLHRRGIFLDASRREDWMAQITVEQAMRPYPEPVSPQMGLRDLARRFAEAEELHALPVLDAEGNLRGTVASGEVERALVGGVTTTTALSLTRTTASLEPGQTLDEALDILVNRSTGGLPVVNPGSGLMIGWITSRDVLRAYSDSHEAQR